MDTLSHESGHARDLHDLAGTLETAQVAFDRLWESVRPATRRQIVRAGIAGDEVEDLLQEIGARLWRLRASVRAESLGAWIALVRKTTVRAMIDRAPREATIAVEEIPLADLPYLEEIALAAFRKRIYEAADRLWLGEPEEPDTEIGAAALRLVFADGLGQDEVAAMFGVDSEAFARWLESPAVLARALFGGLCWPSDDLAGYVLRPDAPLTPQELDRIVASPESIGARVVVWRIRYGLPVERIVGLADGALGLDSVEEALRRAQAAYPFRRVAGSLRSALDVQGRPDALTKPGLWKRIAFEYHTRYDLPHKQILERAAPAADVVRFKFSETTLNNWFGMGRLWSSLAASLQEEAR